MTRLVRNQLIESTNLNDPTRFRSNWSCPDGLDQGVGHQAHQWFIRQNRQHQRQIWCPQPGALLLQAAAARPPWNAAMPETKAMKAGLRATIQANPS